MPRQMPALDLRVMVCASEPCSPEEQRVNQPLRPLYTCRDGGLLDSVDCDGGVPVKRDVKVVVDHALCKSIQRVNVQN